MAYFSNSSEGDQFDQQCGACILGQLFCPVWSVQSLYNYDQCDNPKLAEAMNQLVNKEGICQLKIVLDEAGLQKEQPDPRQMELIK